MLEHSTTFLRSIVRFGQQIDTQSLPRANASPAAIQTALSVVFVVIGAVSVMMVVIGGIKYAGSQGDPQAISKAKGTILYAIVGLVVAILATAIVGFVFGKVA